jgi:hypothetical protein
MNASILYDNDGNILAIFQPLDMGMVAGEGQHLVQVALTGDAAGESLTELHLDLAQTGGKFAEAGMVAGEGQHLVRVALTGDAARQPLTELHQLYRVDPAAKTLVKR